MGLATSPGIAPFDAATPGKLRDLLKPLGSEEEREAFEAELAPLLEKARVLATSTGALQTREAQFMEASLPSIGKRWRKGAAQALSSWRKEFLRCILSRALEPTRSEPYHELG